MKSTVQPNPVADAVAIDTTHSVGARTVKSRVELPERAHISDGAKPFSERLAGFYELTKPRMNALVIVTTLIGFVMVAGTPINWMLLLWTMIGTTICASGAGVLNQWLERRWDAIMPRTVNRPLPTGLIHPFEALSFGIILSIAGVLILALTVNALTSVLGAVTILWYLAIYTPLKRVTTLNTLIGAIPGAIPPLMGFTAASGEIGWLAISVFAILVFWQIPHFFAIATMYRDDYALAGYRMMPVLDTNLSRTSANVIVFTLLLIAASLLPTILGATGYLHSIAAIVLGAWFLYCGGNFWRRRDRQSARKLFFASIIYLPLLLTVMVIDKLT